MERRALGHTDITLSKIGLGCMSFANFFGKTDEPTSHRCLKEAHALGIDFLDTAEIYGRGLSETILGNYFKDNPHDFKIATKGGILWDQEKDFENSKAYFEKALDGSLKRLGRDHVELYYVHRRDQTVPIEDVAETMAGFIKAGKISGYGLSEVSPTTIRRAHAVHPVSAVQSEYSLWSRMPEVGVIDLCERLGITFVPFSPVARGMLTDSQPTPESMADTDFRKNNPRFLRPNYDDNIHQIKAFQTFAADHGWSTAAVALAWVLQRGDHLVPIPGTRTAEHLAELATAAEITLSADDLAEIDRLLPIGWAYGDRYSDAQYRAPETYA